MQRDGNFRRIRIRADVIVVRVSFVLEELHVAFVSDGLQRRQIELRLQRPVCQVDSARVTSWGTGKDFR